MGLHAFLQPGLGRSPIVAISAEGVKLRDFRLRGNVRSVPVEQRASLIAVGANNFIVENGILTDSARHGIIVSARKARANVHTGIIRNITGKNIARDVVSIEGHGGAGYFVHHVIVENIKGFDSHERGAVEVCDGTENITVRNVYAENCVYGVDVQDHGYKGQVNRDISIIGVEVKDCSSAVRTAQSDLGHSNLMIFDISSHGWREDERGRIMSLKNTSNVVLANIKIRENKGSPAIHARNCDGLILRDMLIERCRHSGAAILVEDSSNATIDGLILRGKPQTLTNAVLYQIMWNRDYTNVAIHNVDAPNTLSAGIVLRNRSTNGTLDSYVISGNTTQVRDHIHGKRSLVTNNLMGLSGNEYGADSEATRKVICKSLHQAAYDGDLDQIQMHIAVGKDLNAVDEHDNGRTALHVAVGKGHMDIVKTLIAAGVAANTRSNNGNTPLHTAAYRGLTKMVAFLISKGADVETVNKNRFTPLHSASFSDHIETSELLLDHGANVNAGDKWGITPLHYVAKDTRPAMAKLLIDRGANVNARRTNGETPLHAAARNNRTEMTKLLLAHEADANAKDNEGRTPLWYAKENGHTEIAKLLRKHGAKE
jgi:ankyrin repeat protein